MNFFHHKDLGNHLLQLCPKVVVITQPIFMKTTLARQLFVKIPTMNLIEIALSGSVVVTRQTTWYPHNAFLFSLIKNAYIGATFVTLCICHATLSDQFSVHEAVRLVHLLLQIPSLIVPY